MYTRKYYLRLQFLITRYNCVKISKENLSLTKFYDIKILRIFYLLYTLTLNRRIKFHFFLYYHR